MELSDLLQRLEDATVALKRQPVPEDATADVVGRIRAVERSLAETRRGLMAEIDGDLEGTEYIVRDGRKATRTFNSQAILKDVTDALDTTSVAYALRWLTDAGAVKLSWTWTRLEKAMADTGASLRIQQRPIDEETVDGPHVGVSWKRDIRIEGRSG
jgi:hypothetical protein